jgi:hypothetical protein
MLLVASAPATAAFAAKIKALTGSSCAASLSFKAVDAGIRASSNVRCPAEAPPYLLTAATPDSNANDHFIAETVPVAFSFRLAYAALQNMSYLHHQ